MNFKLALLAALLLVPSRCYAHFLWLEQSCDDSSECRVELYFGEIHQAKRETKETRLLERSGTVLSAIDLSGKAVPLEKRTEEKFFLTEASAKNHQAVVAVDDAAEVADLSKYQIGVVRPIYYARVMLPEAKSSEAGKPAQTLDILPLGEGAHGIFPVGEPARVKVYFNDKPLAQRADVRIYAPNGWSWEGVVDGSGEVPFTPEWPGLYVAEVIVQVEETGTFKDKPYQAVRHRATLSFTAR